MLVSNVGLPCKTTAPKKNREDKRDALVSQQIIGRYRPLVILATSTLLAQTAPGVLQVVLNVETEETKVLILQVGQDVGTQMILVTAILYQETACTFRNVIVKQNVSLMSNLGLTESTTLVGVSLDGREMGSNAMIRKVFQVQKHYRLEMFPLQWQSVATIMCIHITLPNFLLDQARQILSTISQRCLTLEQPVPANQIVKVLSSISKNPLNRRSST